jgi:hypothetical protein
VIDRCVVLGSLPQLAESSVRFYHSLLPDRLIACFFGNEGQANPQLCRGRLHPVRASLLGLAKQSIVNRLPDRLRFLKALTGLRFPGLPLL